LYVVYKIREWIGIPPMSLRENRPLDEIALDILRSSIEGTRDPEHGIFLAVTDARVLGDGILLPADPHIYYPVEYEVLAYKPVLLEVARGRVKEAREFGLFVDLGPLDGFVHRSQIMDDKVEYEPASRTFTGLETKKSVGVGDVVRVRIVQISGADRVSRQLRIGLTMRQPYLGREDWIREEATRETGGE
jgi:DNA-directed RNA polymerase subunit E'